MYIFFLQQFVLGDERVMNSCQDCIQKYLVFASSVYTLLHVTFLLHNANVPWCEKKIKTW